MSAEQLKVWDEHDRESGQDEGLEGGIAKNGWDDAYMPSAEYKAFLEKEGKSFRETFGELGIMKKK